MVKLRQPMRGRRAQPVSIGAPTGGLNGRDNFSDMPATDAFVLDNWFPYNTSVDTRGGSLTFSTGMPGPVESLEVYTCAAGAKMLAFSAGDIYEVSAGGAVGAALMSGNMSSQVTTAMFSNAGSQFLLIYSGADAPLSYDGTSLTALVITGLTGSQDLLMAGMAFKGRIYLTQAETLGFYYLEVGAIQGAASFFDLQQQSLKGGALAAIASFSQESMGSGPQDFAVFATTEGEYIMYAGTDPSNAATWELVGRYLGPPPIGRKGWVRFRSDLYFITEEGILSFTQIRQMGEDAETNQYITAKLGRHYDEAVQHQSVHGWCGMLYPRGNALFVNVPLSGGENGGYAQYVLNTNSNAWTRYTGWNGISWALFGRRAYFGTYDGKVVLADEGFTDDGTEVIAICRQAWNAFDDTKGMGAADKQFHFATFAVSAEGAPSVSCNINVNYEDDQPSSPVALVDAPGGAWDVATWDVDFWANNAFTQNVTAPIGKLGYIASIWMQASTLSSTLRWFATRIVLEKTQEVLLQ